jgi:hypothetical protein
MTTGSDEPSLSFIWMFACEHPAQFSRKKAGQLEKLPAEILRRREPDGALIGACA